MQLCFDQHFSGNQFIFRGVLDGYMIGMDDKRFCKLRRFCIADNSFRKPRWCLTGIAAVKSPFSSGKFEGYQCIQFLGSPHDAGNHMLDPGVAGHDDERGAVRAHESSASIYNADPAVRTEEVFYLIRYILSEYLICHRLDRNIPMFLKN